MGAKNEKMSVKTIMTIVVIVLVLIILILLFLPSKESNKATISSDKTTGETLKVLGENPYYVIKGTTYEEPGYEAHDAVGNDISYKVTKSGVVNVDAPGNYYLIYELGNIKIKRTVIVYNFEVILAEETTEYTNEPYNLMVIIKGNNYDKTLLPDGTTTKEQAIEYEINKNGTYEFVSYDTHNNQVKVKKEVTNFDNEGPTGTCTNKLDVGKTYVTVDAKDEPSGVAHYIYNNGSDTVTTKEAKYTYNALYKDINVTLVDKLGNKRKIKCKSSGEGAYPQIKPAGVTSYHKVAESDTLKVLVVKKDGYYLAYIWVLDPYNQINKGTSSWGKNVLTPANILKNETSKLGLENKIAIGVNGSGFYSAPTWTPTCSSECKRAYDKTTEGGFAINNGVVMKNYYQDTYVDKYRNDAIYAISKDGYLEVYPNINNYSESGRKDLFNSIISKGYRNTWVFRPVFMLNGKKTSPEILGNFLNTGGKRTAVCQIDRNNFILFATSNGSHNVDNLVSIFSAANCKTAINLDGGGSTAMVFKPKGGSVEAITGGTRQIVDTFYFTEK